MQRSIKYCAHVAMMCVGIAPSVTVWAETDQQLQMAATTQLTVDQLAAADFAGLMDLNITVASRLPSSIANSPGSVSVFDSMDFERLGVHTLNELLNFVPGMMTVGPSNGVVMGVNSRGSYSSFANTTLLLIDGIPVNNYINGSWAYQNNLYPLNNVARAEIMHGPAAAVYGAGAVNAVINLISKKNSKAVSLELGADRTARVSAAGFTQVGDFTVNAMLTAHTDHGQRFTHLQTADFAYDIQDSVKDGLIDVTRDAIKRHDIQLDVSNGGLSFGAAHSQYKLTGYYDRDVYLLNNLTYTQDEESRWYASYKYNLSPLWAVALAYNGQYDTENRMTVLFDVAGNYDFYAFGPAGFVSPDPAVLAAYPAGLPVDALSNIRINTLKQKLDGHITYTPNSKLNAVFGVDGTSSKLLDDTTRINYDLTTLQALGGFYDAYGKGNIYNANADNDKQWGIYGESKCQLSPKLAVNAGLRYDHFEDQKAVLSPRMSLVYNFLPAHTLKFIYNKAFKKQSSSFLYTNLTLPYANIGPIDYKVAEIAYNFDGEILHGSASFYTEHINNILQLAGVTAGSQIGIAKLPSTKKSGIELSSTLLWGANTRLMGSMQYTLKDNQTVNTRAGGVLPPRLIGSAGVNQQINKVNVGLSAYAHLHTAHQEIPLGAIDGNMPSTVMVNATGNYKYSQALTLKASINNLFNRQYNGYEPMDSPTGSFFPIRGRVLLVGGSYQF